MTKFNIRTFFNHQSRILCNLYSGAKTISLASQRPFHFHCSVGAFFLVFCWLLYFVTYLQIPMDHQSGILILNVSHNSIVDIPKRTFPKLYELHTIDFSYNNLSEIDRSVFTNLLSLRHLYFQHNNLSDLVSLSMRRRI